MFICHFTLISQCSGKDKKKKDVSKSSASTSKSDDFFAEVIIDELKAENLELRSAVDARDRQLQGAADKVN